MGFEGRQLGPRELITHLGSFLIIKSGLNGLGVSIEPLRHRKLVGGLRICHAVHAKLMASAAIYGA